MATNFLDISRNNPGYRDNRVEDYSEVEKRLSAEELRKQASRCMGCGIAFCHGYGCPLFNNIQEFNLAVSENRMKDAYNILSTTSSFPEFTARICPAPCEAACCAGLAADPVAIRQVEYEIIEHAFKNGYVTPRPSRNRTGLRVAIIGSGPAGLTAADHLNKMGHEVVVFEKNANIGGLLRYGIPDFKLDKAVIERRVDILNQEGVFFEAGVEIGFDISADYLRKKFDAICLCVGSEVPRDLVAEGRELAGVHFAMEFLSSQNRVVSGEKPELSICAKGKKVLVIGGGDTGSDCVGTSHRHGAKEVVQIEIMPEPPKERHDSSPWPEWPYSLRTSSSHLEGGKRLWGVMVKKLEGKNGAVKSVTASLCDWELDGAGRPKRPVERPDSKFKIDADLVLLSMGFTGVQKGGIVDQLGIRLSERGVIATDKNLATNITGVFAAGDSVSGPSLVVRAMAAGKNVARCIDSYLKTLLKV